jgi:hypothetical protein
MTTQTLPIDPDRLQAIRGAMDPLAIIGVFLYYVTKDVTGIQFSPDTLLWFVAAASAVRTMMTQTIDRILEGRRKAIEHERMVELARLNAASSQAAIAAQQAAKQAIAAFAQAQGVMSESSGIGEVKIDGSEDPHTRGS